MPLGSVRTASLSLSLSPPPHYSMRSNALPFPVTAAEVAAEAAKKKITFVRTDTQVLPAKAEVAAHSSCSDPRSLRLTPLCALLLTPYCVRPRSLCRAPLYSLLLTPHYVLFTPHCVLLTPQCVLLLTPQCVLRCPALCIPLALPSFACATVAVSPLIWYAPANYSH